MGALRIQIFIPQNQSALILEGALRRDLESPRMTNMQKRGWRWREATAISCAMRF
jgi:hypothetical protein